MYEYGVMQKNQEGLHRGPMTEDEAVEWVREWDEMNDNGVFVPDLFYVVRREVSEWEKVNLV